MPIIQYFQVFIKKNNCKKRKIQLINTKTFYLVCSKVVICFDDIADKCSLCQTFCDMLYISNIRWLHKFAKSCQMLCYFWVVVWLSARKNNYKWHHLVNEMCIKVHWCDTFQRERRSYCPMRLSYNRTVSNPHFPHTCMIYVRCFKRFALKFF